jgi:UDP-glucose 4-epimerase
VLGAAGFVGRNILNGLKDSEFEITSSDIIDLDSGTQHIKIDITDLADIKKVVDGVDVVVHLAVHSLTASFKDSLMNANVNIMGTLNILEAARLSNVKKVIFTSASSIIGKVDYSPVDENHPCTPKTPYAVTKLAAEHYLRIYQELYGLNYIIFRFFNIYGPYQTEGLIPILYKRISSNQPIDIYGGGKQIRDYVFIRDVVPFFHRAIKDDSVKNMMLNMGTGKGTSVIEIVNTASRVLGVKPNMNHQPARKGEIDNYVAEIKLLKSVFGKVPSTSVEDGLKETFAWLKSS